METAKKFEAISFNSEHAARLYNLLLRPEYRSGYRRLIRTNQELDSRIEAESRLERIFRQLF